MAESTPMPRSRRALLRGTLALAAGIGSAARAAVPAQVVKRQALAFGTRVSVTLVGMPAAEAEAAAEAALSEIRAVDAAVGLHRAGSELAALNRAGRLATPGAHLRFLLAQARRWGQASDGAFDVTVQPLWALYFAASVRGGLPPPAAVARQREAIDWRALSLSPGAGAAFDRPGMQATLNGLAQGYATDRAWAVLRQRGVVHALIDGGEWRAAGSGWRIGVRDPRRSAALVQAVDLTDGALASSGNDGFAFTADRRLYHILDPRSGRSPSELAGATVLAADACTADALSTACMVLGTERALALVDSVPGAQALLIRRDGRLATTDGWPR